MSGIQGQKMYGNRDLLLRIKLVQHGHGFLVKSVPGVLRITSIINIPKLITARATEGRVQLRRPTPKNYLFGGFVPTDGFSTEEAMIALWSVLRTDVTILMIG